MKKRRESMKDKRIPCMVRTAALVMFLALVILPRQTVFASKVTVYTGTEMVDETDDGIGTDGYQDADGTDYQIQAFLEDVGVIDIIFDAVMVSMFLFVIYYIVWWIRTWISLWHED